MLKGKQVLIIGIIIIVGLAFLFTTNNEPQVATETEIQEALLNIHPDWDPDTFTVSISADSTENHARGGVNFNPSGAAWFATNVNSEWKIVYDGQDLPPCEAFEGYNFPSEWIEGCY